MTRFRSPTSEKSWAIVVAAVVVVAVAVSYVVVAAAVVVAVAVSCCRCSCRCWLTIVIVSFFPCHFRIGVSDSTGILLFALLLWLLLLPSPRGRVRLGPLPSMVVHVGTRRSVSKKMKEEAEEVAEEDEEERYMSCSWPSPSP